MLQRQGRARRPPVPLDYEQKRAGNSASQRGQHPVPSTGPPSEPLQPASAQPRYRGTRGIRDVRGIRSIRRTAHPRRTRIRESPRPARPLFRAAWAGGGAGARVRPGSEPGARVWQQDQRHDADRLDTGPSNRLDGRRGQRPGHRAPPAARSPPRTACAGVPTIAGKGMDDSARFSTPPHISLCINAARLRPHPSKAKETR